MKFGLALIVFFISSFSWAGLDLMQTSPDFQWYTISNDSVQVIYPDVMQAESVYIANLVEHYSQFVGKTYGIDHPKKFPLIIRPGMGASNAYVTLAPRRSEWFASNTIIPFVGVNEWYQTLAVHEYRHVNQFDHFNQSGAHVLYSVMGDMGLQLAMFLTLPSWYFEGDAVWTETKYMDGGRGRSPRFLARLKALVLSNQIPTYDEFLSGTYRTSYPNHYVYGYALISYGVQKFGEDIWKKVTDATAVFPVPYKFYLAFEHVTGQNFEDFYKETMLDLKKKWAADAPASVPSQIPDYRQQVAPAHVGESLYYVESTLDALPSLMREHQGEKEKIATVLYNHEVQGLSYRGQEAIYSEYLPDSRYESMGFSDLVLVDLKSGHRTQITHGQRLYNPGFNSTGEKILAINYKLDQSWNIAEYDRQGQLLQEFSMAPGKVMDAKYWDGQTAVVLLNSKIGERSLVLVDLKTHQVVKEILKPSHNLLNALQVDPHQQLFFEAQFKGGNEIFKYDGNAFSRCTTTKLGAFTPYSDGNNLYYSDMDSYGGLIRSSPLAACQAFDGQQLVDFHYLGEGPSDNYNNFPIQHFPEQADLFTRNADKYHPEEYGDFDRELFIPHNWGLLIDRGFGLGVESDNYLRTMDLNAVFGTNAEEGGKFAELSYDFKKYYPVFSLNVGTRDRDVLDFDENNELKWKEKYAGLSVLIPYLKKVGQHNFTANAKLEGSYVDTSKYKYNDNDINGSEYFYKSAGLLGLAWNTDPHTRSIQFPWLLSYSIRYDNAEQPSDKSKSSFRVFQSARMETPALFSNDGFKLTYDQQRQRADSSAYSFLPSSDGVFSYAFSRGYRYKNVFVYDKVTANYLFPVGYPDWNIWGWYYLNRCYANLFFDSTQVSSNSLHPTLNSYGAELMFESKLLRIIPVTYGLRLLQRMDDSVVIGEGFLASGVMF